MAVLCVRQKGTLEGAGILSELELSLLGLRKLIPKQTGELIIALISAPTHDADSVYHGKECVIRLAYLLPVPRWT